MAPSYGNWEVKPNRLFVGEYGKYIADEKLKKFVLGIVQLPGCNMDNRMSCGKLRNVDFLGNITKYAAVGRLEPRTPTKMVLKN
ncbi:MAG: hypothetical protein FWD16_00045 [Clostridia bacterium]|nr:hypothetical protein [Clostridia bacterium]